MSDQPKNTRSGHGLWLSRAALGFVALAAVMGWGASFVGLHAYGQDQMVGFSYWSAWLIPATFDGAAFGATLITYRASIYGRSAVRGRLLMWTFTAISSWINWIHQTSPEARIVAAGLPVAAVAVFDVVLAELRADYEERHGKRRLRLRPGLLLLRWLVDRGGTAGAFRQQVTDIPVSEIAGLRSDSPVLDAPARSTQPAVLQAPVTPAAARPLEPAPPPRAEPAPNQPPATTRPGPEVPAASRETAPQPTAISRPEPVEPVPAATPQPQQETTTSQDEPEDPPTATVLRPEPEPQRPAMSETWREFPEPATPEPESGPNAEIDTGNETKPGSAQQETNAPRPAGDVSAAEQTQTLPPVPADPLTDENKRTFARRDYRLSLEIGEPITGAQLGQRYGFSERWGRRQIAAVRVEMEQDDQDRELVSVD